MNETETGTDRNATALLVRAAVDLLIHFNGLVRARSYEEDEAHRVALGYVTRVWNQEGV